nr:hypothetical protein [Bradyrhizobium sp. SZCCHNS2005]
MDDHGRNQPPHALAQLVAVAQIRAGQQTGQLFQVLPVALDGGRVKRNDFVAFLDRGELALDLIALGFKPLDRPGQCRRIDASLYDCVDCPVEFPGDLALAPFQLAALAARVAREFTALVVIGLHVLDQVGWFCQFPLHARKRQMLDIVTLDAAAVAALAALAKRGALNAIGAVPIASRHHAPAATAAAKQPGKDAALFMRARLGRCTSLRSRLVLAGLRRLPEIIADNPQVRCLRDPPLIGRVRPRDAPFRGRVLDHANLVPHDLADVDLIQQQTMSALQVAVDGRGVPALAARRRNGSLVEIMRNVAR